MPAKRGETAETRVGVRLQSGFHVNSNTPNEAYLIPLRLTWDAGALDAVQVVYPKSEQRNYQFSQKPVSVFTGDFDIVTRFKVTPGAPSGPGVLKGKLRYQACNNSSCLPPRTLDLRLSYSIQ
jgi:thioredoxin:protein disulfide reductase